MENRRLEMKLKVLLMLFGSSSENNTKSVKLKSNIKERLTADLKSHSIIQVGYNENSQLKLNYIPLLCISLATKECAIS